MRTSQWMGISAASVETGSRLARCLGGDQAAFAEVVRDHQDMVFSLAWHYLGDPAVAEEVAQEVFLHLYRNLDAIQSEEHLTHWLRKVTVHRSIDETRRRRHRPRALPENLPEPAVSAADPDPLRSDRLRRLIRKLPERSQMLLILRYQEDLDPIEIARVLDVPLGTVKSGLHRALATLRERWNKGAR